MENHHFQWENLLFLWFNQKTKTYQNCVPIEKAQPTSMVAVRIAAASPLMRLRNFPWMFHNSSFKNWVTIG
jgi:hypothetical protein